MATPKRPAPPPPVEDPELLKSYFNRVDKDGSGSISAQELQLAFTFGSDSQFQLSTIKAMMEAFALDNAATVNFDQFGHLWRYIMDWQKCFRRFDHNKSGTIDVKELHTALTTFGYNLSDRMVQLLAQRFIGKNRIELNMDDFIRCCLILFVSYRL